MADVLEFTTRGRPYKNMNVSTSLNETIGEMGANKSISTCDKHRTFCQF
jgi:hypothetical protein